MQAPSKKNMKRQSMMVLAQQEASVKGSRAGDFSSVRGGALQSQGFGGFLSSFKTQEQMLKQKKIEEN